MQATLEHPLRVPSQLAEEVIAYLDDLAVRMAELPKYYPAHLRVAENGKTRFDDIRQMVQIVEDRSRFERWLAEERERLRAAGQGFDDSLAYAPRRSRPENDEHEERQRDRPSPPPPPVPWDEHAGDRFRRAVILGDPEFGKTWLLRYEARRLAHVAAEGLREHTIRLEDVVLPGFLRLSALNQSDQPVEKVLLKSVGQYRSPRFRQFFREKLATKCCAILLDAWDEVPVEQLGPDDKIHYRKGFRQRLGQRLEVFARVYPQPRLLLTSRIVGCIGSPVPDAEELELLAFDTPLTVFGPEALETRAAALSVSGSPGRAWWPSRACHSGCTR